VVGSIGWLAQSTRPDLASAHSFLSSYNNRPSKSHWNAALYAPTTSIRRSTMALHSLRQRKCPFIRLCRSPLHPTPKLTAMPFHPRPHNTTDYPPTATPVGDRNSGTQYARASNSRYSSSAA
jgi:hypothetical protein